jgi:hypothetical protein
MHANSSLERHVDITTISATDGSVRYLVIPQVTKWLKNELSRAGGGSYNSYQFCGWLRNWARAQ